MHEPIVFGLNYATASFTLREKLAFSQDKISHVLERLQHAGITQEAVILSTCNRTEVYCLTQDIDFVINAICDIQGACPRTVKNYSYVYAGNLCAKHLFYVASGLDSMILGETEIVAQIKAALHLAKDCGSVKSELAALFQMALAAAKEVRARTQINHTAVSIGSAVIKVVEKHFPDVSCEQVLFIGAGEMMRQIAPHFKTLNIAKKMIINRTPQHAKALAKRIDAEYTGLDNLAHLVNSYSIIIACSGGGASLSVGSMLLNATILAPSIQGYGEFCHKKVLIIDLSMPLITDLQLANYANISVITIDDIAKIVDVGVRKRKLAANAAHAIINEQLRGYQNWQKKRELTPVIRALREHAEIIRQDVLSAAEKQLYNGVAANNVLRDLSIQLSNKLLHAPTVKLSAGETAVEQQELAQLVMKLYSLEL